MPGVLSEKAEQQLRDVVRKVLREERTPLPGSAVTGTPQPRWLGKTAAAHDKDDTGTIDLYSGTTKGAETTTGVSIAGVYNRFADLLSGKWVFIEFIDGGWELYAAEC